MGNNHEKYQRLIGRCKALPPTPTAVAHPCDVGSLQGAVDAAKAGLIAPILVGPIARIRDIAAKAGLDISGYPMVNAAFSQESAENRRARQDHEHLAQSEEVSEEEAHHHADVAESDRVAVDRDGRSEP